MFASWGGAYQDAERVSYCEPFATATGARVVQDGPMNGAKFRAMIEGGAPDWDVADVTIDFLYAGAPDKLLEPIDRAIVDTSRIDPKAAHSPRKSGRLDWPSAMTSGTATDPAAILSVEELASLEALVPPGSTAGTRDPVAGMRAAYY